MLSSVVLQVRSEVFMKFDNWSTDGRHETIGRLKTPICEARRPHSLFLMQALHRTNIHAQLMQSPVVSARRTCLNMGERVTLRAHIWYRIYISMVTVNLCALGALAGCIPCSF